MTKHAMLVHGDKMQPLLEMPYLCIKREQQNRTDFVNGKGWINCIEFVLHEGTEKKAAFVIGNGMNKPYRNCKWGSNNHVAFVHEDTKNDEQIIPDL